MFIYIYIYIYISFLCVVNFLQFVINNMELRDTIS